MDTARHHLRVKGEGHRECSKKRSWNIIPDEQDYCNTQVPNNLPASEGHEKHPGVITMDFVFLAVILLFFFK